MRILSIPSGHVYVRHLSSPGLDDGVVRLPDPPARGDVPAAQWWPPPSLDAAWVRDHADSFDVAHLHFGFDARTPAELDEWVQALHELGKPLVYTVHDLRNPHHRDRRQHDAQLDVLVPAADALVTLTKGAAREIEERWGRVATVLPHPHVVPEPTLSAPRPPHEGFVVGVHLKSLRASMDPLPVLAALSKVVPALPDATLRVDVHTDVMTPGAGQHDPVVAALLGELADDGQVDLRVHDYFSDDELWDYFLGLDVSVLPYRFGTHSGWLEACYDLGTVVVAPDCGFYADQRPCLTYRTSGSGPDIASLEREIEVAYAERPGWRADPDVRRAERETLAREHAALYDAVLGR